MPLDKSILIQYIIISLSSRSVGKQLEEEMHLKTEQMQTRLKALLAPKNIFSNGEPKPTVCIFGSIESAPVLPVQNAYNEISTSPNLRKRIIA